MDWREAEGNDRFVYLTRPASNGTKFFPTLQRRELDKPLPPEKNRQARDERRFWAQVIGERRGILMVRVIRRRKGRGRRCSDVEY